MTTKVYGDYVNIFGSNNLGAKDSFTQRLKYQIEYPFGYLPPILKSGNLIDQFDTPKDLLPLSDEPEPINFWSSKYEKYGRVDENNNVIVPDISKFKQIRTENETLFVFPFVADAFEDLVEFIKTQRANRLHPDQFLTLNIEAKRAWFNIDEHYKKVLDQYISNFVGVFLLETKLAEQILDFESFLNVFLNFYSKDIIGEFPMTKTATVDSRKTSPNTSGLCVEVSLDSHSDDYNKFNKYLNNINYEFYTLAAAKFGFFVDKNAPWRLVANIESPKMKEYMQKYFFTIDPNGFTGNVLSHYHTYTIDQNGNGITEGTKYPGGVSESVPDHQHEIVNGKIQIKAVYGPNPLVQHVHGYDTSKKFIPFTTGDLYNKFYVKTYEQDVELLKNALFKFYSDFVRDNPAIEIPKLCLPQGGVSNSPKGAFAVRHLGEYYDAGSKRKTVIQTILRKELDDYDLSRYDDLFWLKTYLIIRIKEKTGGKGELNQRLNKVMSDINQLYYYVDKQSALEYIQTYLKQYY